MANDYAFQVTCDHTESCKSGGPGSEDALMDVRNANKSAWLSEAEADYRIQCGECGCEYDIEPSGGEVVQVDVSRPRIDSLGTASGSVAGGTNVQVNGHRLNFANPVVKFDGVTATNVADQQDGSLTCDTPAGKIRLVETGMRRHKLSFDNLSGTFQADETITGGTSGATAVVREVESSYLLVDSLTGDFQDDEQITGGTSSATADVNGVIGGFVDSETLIGATSGSSATLFSASTLKVSSPTGAFTAGEWVSGSTSGAKVQLDNSTPMDGAVDVTVENDNGQRDTGYKLEGAFEYTV